MDELLRNVLLKKGLVSERDIENLENEVTQKLKLKNILTKDELEEVVATLQDFKPPKL